ncbi:MAG: MarR family transcriptional regulator [Clostridia bacterium]|nr:MarR family transcriptional regulator [Clostridia bacterium]
MIKVTSNLGYLISKLHQKSNSHLAVLLKKEGVRDVTPGLGKILFALWQKDNVNMNQLAAETQLDKSTMTTMVNRLEKHGLVRRLPDPCDRRATIIQLTEESYKRKDIYEKVSEEMNNLLLKGIDQEELAVVARVLGKMLDNLSS